MNETQVQIKFRNSVTNFKRLQEYEQKLKSLKGLIESMPKNFSLGNNVDKKLETTNKLLVNLNKNMSSFKRSTTSTLGNMSKDVSKVNKNLGKLETKTKTTNKQLENAFNIQSFKQASAMLLKFSTNISKFTNKSAEYLENWNLLDVAFQNNTTEAEKFVNTLTEMYGLDESWGYRTIGIFKQLSNAMGLSDETGTQLAKTLTQLAIDTSSLYNIGVQDTVSILQSGLAGQTKPVRRLGGDITQSTLQTTLDSVGIDKAINQLSYAEKRLVIVATLLNQTSEASGDWGRTIESVANQMRIFQQQTERLTRALGNVFLPILKAILPYLNAMLMVLTEIIQWIAVLVGYNEEEFDFFGSGDAIANFSDEIANLGANLDSTNESAKKLQNGLRSFDKLNNIKTPSANSPSGGSGVGTVSKDILDLFNNTSDNYLNNIEKIEMKATKIRDNIMDVLGFSKSINLITGEVVWTYEGWKETLKGVYEWFKELNPLAKVFVGLAIVKTFSSMYGAIKKIIGLKMVTNIVDPFKKLYKELNNINFANTNLTKGIGNSLSTWRNNLSTMEKVTTTLTLATTSYLTMQDAISRTNDSLGDWVLTLGESVVAMGSAALAGYTLAGPIGAVVGVVGNMAATLYSATKQMEINTDVGAKYAQTLNDIKEQSLRNIDVTTLQMDRANKLLPELKELIDSNGKIKKGHEDRANFILTTLNKAYGTEYELVNGIITKNGEQAKSYDEIATSIDKMYKEKVKEIKLKAYEDIYIEALKQEAQINKDIAMQQGILEFNQERLNKAKETGRKIDGFSAKELEKSLERTKERIDSLESSRRNAQNEILSYEKLLEASMSETEGAYEEALEKYETGTINATDNATQNAITKWGEVKGSVETDFNNIKLQPLNAKINVDADTTKANTTISTFMQRINGSISKMFGLPPLTIGGTKANGGIYKNGKWHDITQYASGGLPPIGQMFVAREKGPELVGTIGGSTAVMNNDQIVGSVSAGVYQAVRSAMGTNSNQVFNIYLDADHQIGTYTLNQLQEMAKSNGEAITIG